MPVLIRCWGDYACFTRPEMKAERVSYDVMTPSAARGILDAIYWHPGLTWVVERIWVCKPIRFMSINRNELKSIMNCQAVVHAIDAKSELPTCDPAFDHTPRASLILKDVEYVVQAHLEADATVPDLDKVQRIVDKRLARGACYSRPYFGCREFPVQFERVHQAPMGVFGDKDFGWMLWDMDYHAKGGPQPLFFRAMMQNGCITVPDRRRVS